MTRALVYKEFRETLGIGAIGMALLLLMTANKIGLRTLPFSSDRSGTIPFVSDGFSSLLILFAGGLAIALGLRQSLGDFWGDAQLFLIHRPISRRRIYTIKILVGLSVYLFCVLLPIALYATWAAMPGTHASPFVWSMTEASWVVCIALTAVYLGALLTGTRPAAWFGTRLAPLLAAAGLAFPIMFCWFAVALAFVLAIDVILIYIILAEAHTREFA